MIQQDWLSEQRKRIKSEDVLEAFDLLVGAARNDDRYLLGAMANGDMPTAKYSRLPGSPRERRPAFSVNADVGLLFYTQLVSDRETVEELRAGGFDVTHKDGRIRIRVNTVKDARFVLDRAIEAWLERPV